jgi:poly(hydroxyalkanoate) granule-associated protein
VSERPIERQLAETGRTLWLAGLGAVAEVERGGRAVFAELVARGRRVETWQFRAIDRAVARAADGAERMGEGVRGRLHGRLDELLHRAHLPTRDDLHELTARLDRLAERVERLGGTTGRTS